EIADKVGKDRASVANYMRLLKLPEEVKEFIREEKISMGHARAILSLENEQEQIEVANLVVKKGLSVRETEKIVQKYKTKAPRIQKSLEDPDLKALEEELVRHFGTKVVISGNRQKGSIRIFYFSLDDLNRVYDKIKGVK
ncbi:MAG: hypothetical protein H5U07_11530, partial [Candidatus Aminicenantes bacterium]|nr:hypothetical protein [Candidatus Aminicenantes bacterium]